MKTAIVIPAYQEAATIRAIAQRAAVVADLAIVVDDGSTDGTLAALDGLPVEVLRHEKNLGKAASLWDGMRAALARGAEVVVTMDGDGQHGVDDVPRLVRALAAHPGRIAIGARMRRAGPAPLARRFANRFADFWISWAAGHRILDTQSGQRAYPAALLRELDLAHGPSRGFTFESESLIEAARLGYRTVSIPVDAIYGTSARSRHFRPWRDTIRIGRMIAGRLLCDRLSPRGLVRSLRHGAVVVDGAPQTGVGAAFEDSASLPGSAD